MRVLDRKRKTLNISHPDEARLPRLPDSIDQPITAMPLSRMKNPTFAKPHIQVITTRDRGLCYSPDAQKTTSIQREIGKEIKKGNGCSEVPLQLKTNSIKGNLSDNYDVAEKGFIPLEKIFYRDESLFERYNSVMKEQLKQGIIERCTENYFAGYVMPHREVFRENYSSTKTGVVYDANSKQENNLSLNECLISGENLNLIHIDVTLKFKDSARLLFPHKFN
ncbi:uncharacterized protein TNCV_2302551 [Trichonephila clavipes]|nr:uncharacterized protein TNCV_2302551 [Trichonephila clavipes]